MSLCFAFACVAHGFAGGFHHVVQACCFHKLRVSDHMNIKLLSYSRQPSGLSKEVGRLGGFSLLISLKIIDVTAQGTTCPSRLGSSCRRQVDEGSTLLWEETLVGSQQ